MLAIEGAAFARLHSFAEAEDTLSKAEQICASASERECGNVLRARGVLAIEQGQLELARTFFEKFLAFARGKRDPFMEGSALLNLSAYSLKEEHFDEAIDWAEAAHRSATAINAGNTITKSLGNLGWAYFRLGDSEKSLELSLEAEKRAAQVGDIVDQLYWITNAGYVYQQLNDLPRAKQSYLRALNLARNTRGQQGIYNALRALAMLSIEKGEIDDARKYSEEAASMAERDHNRLDQLYPLLVKAVIASQCHDSNQAERFFREVEIDPNTNASLKWRAEHGLAQLYDSQGRASFAEHEYRAAITTFESARGDVRREESHLAFLTNGWRIYDDYVHFLLESGRTDEALRWADYSRARTLAEGLGVLPAKTKAEAPPLHAQEIARAVNGTLLFYWLGEKQSYLWAISPKNTRVVTLPAGQEIEAVAKRYREAITGPQSAPLTNNSDGQWLYRTLIAPAQPLIARNARVFIIPDGSLNNLNFDTLVATTPSPHYWIEDATIANASSLRMLAASYPNATSAPIPSELRRTRVSAQHSRTEPALSDPEHREGESKGISAPHLLLIGNSVAPNEKYPELPRAAAQMQGVAAHFPAAQERVIARQQATPQAYLEANPQQFSHIHFVAHGTASRLSPLDSAIVLSKSSNDSESFKLYARDIIQHPLRADVVTISSCYGAGTRAYSGEGLVGLSWAFLRAGAHNVVAALWEATDTPTEQLMTRFYDELNRGASPDEALHTAKLALLHGGTFSNPVYWAPFQLYTQGMPGRRSNQIHSGS